jgi:hypothetical protein
VGAWCSKLIALPDGRETPTPYDLVNITWGEFEQSEQNCTTSGEEGKEKSRAFAGSGTTLQGIRGRVRNL